MNAIKKTDKNRKVPSNLAVCNYCKILLPLINLWTSEEQEEFRTEVYCCNSEKLYEEFIEGSYHLGIFRLPAYVLVGIIYFLGSNMMKNKSKRIIVFFMTWIVASGFMVFADTAGYGSRGVDSATNMILEEMLVHALEDEYLARAEYRLIIAQYGSFMPFRNIVRSERQHIAWVKTVMKKYNYEIPADKANEYVILPKDRKTALEIGVVAEVVNIAMYDKFLAQKLPSDVRDLFQALKNGSRHHLMAFQMNLDRGRGRYR